MPAIYYGRLTDELTIAAAGDVATISVNSVSSVEVPRQVLDRAASGDDAELRSAVSSLYPFVALPVQDSFVHRTTVEVADRAWAAIPFETYLPPGCVLRTSQVYSRMRQVPLTFPMRVLETGSPDIVHDAIEKTFHGTYREHAFVDARTTIAGAHGFLHAERWATVEILHAHDLAVSESILSTARSGEPCTVGWLLRFADRYQTRLIVIDADPADLPLLRVAAQTIIDRGGPMVWLAARGFDRFDLLYGYIAHDRPLDWIRAELPGELFACAGDEESLRYSRIGEALGSPRARQYMVEAITGEFRPIDIVRYTPPPWGQVRTVIVDTAKLMGIDLTGPAIPFWQLQRSRGERLADVICTTLTRSGLAVRGLDVYCDIAGAQGRNITIDDLMQHVQSNSVHLAQLTPAAATQVFSENLERIRWKMPEYQFEDHESDGMLPLAEKVAFARGVANVLRRERRAGRRGGRPMRPGEPQHVNTAFYAALPDGSLTRMPQAGTRLKPGALVHFGVDIGAKSTLTVTLGGSALLEEQIRWEDDGAWIEIGVTAIDFDLVGDPVQEVWLPLHYATDLVTFAVRPRSKTTVAGVARLRVAVYSQNNLVQSFLVAALLEGAEGDLASALARGVNATAEEVRALGELGYLPRLEYATGPVAAAPSAPGRALTIIANSSAGDKVVTIKGADLFTVAIDNLLPDKVKLAREALDRASGQGPTYFFMFNNERNRGDPDKLLDALWDIARTGFDMFNLLVPAADEKRRVSEIIATGMGVHAAHIDASTVIPWPLLYDRPVFNARKWSDTDGTQYDVERGVCLACMPAADGTMKTASCGGNGCLLDPAENDRRKKAGKPIYIRESVICPQRFWGFAVPIEVPAQQVNGVNAAVVPLADKITASQPAQVVAGFNESLVFTDRHRNSLKDEVFTRDNGTVKVIRAELVRPPHPGRDALWQFLITAQPDIVYFFCHALASLQSAGRTIGPSLDFGMGHEGVIDDVLEPQDFHGDSWTNAPLVFINGCSTAGFSPYAPSEFIRQFIRGRKASAVIGTEVALWEVLASEVAEFFLKEFLDGKSAGAALLSARRALLAKHNPLGLVYTLYGSANLALATTAAAGSP